MIIVNFYKKISVDINKNKLFYFIYIPLTALFFIWGFMLVYHPETAAEGVTEGIELCLGTVIPSLFPFLFFSSVLSESGILNGLVRLSEKAARFLFALPGISVPIILMSMTGGYPVGGFLIKKAFEKGELTASQGKRLMSFCVNPGPGFAVATVGNMMLGSKKAGLIIYASTIASSLIIGFFTRFFDTEGEKVKSLNQDYISHNSIHNIISDSVNSSANAIANICIWIIIFACLNRLAETLPINQSLFMLFRCLSEVTNGVVTTIDNYPLPLVSGVVSFAGVCVHLQLLPYITALRLKYKNFLTVRIVAASLSTMISGFLFRLIPISVSTVSLGTKPTASAFEASVPVCICLLIMCGLFLIGDNYTIAGKSRGRNR